MPAISDRSPNHRVNSSKPYNSLDIISNKYHSYDFNFISLIKTVPFYKSNYKISKFLQPSNSYFPPPNTIHKIGNLKKTSCPITKFVFCF